MERKIKDLWIKVISVVFGLMFAIIAGYSRHRYRDSIWSLFILLFTFIFFIFVFIVMIQIHNRNRPGPTVLEQEEPIGEDLPGSEVIKVQCPNCRTQQLQRGIRPFEAQCGRCDVTLVIPENR